MEISAFSVELLTAACLAHRACCGSEHDPANGKLHGYCVVCGVPWPCSVAKRFLASESDSVREALTLNLE